MVKLDDLIPLDSSELSLTYALESSREYAIRVAKFVYHSFGESYNIAPYPNAVVYSFRRHQSYCNYILSVLRVQKAKYEYYVTNSSGHSMDCWSIEEHEQFLRHGEAIVRRVKEHHEERRCRVEKFKEALEEANKFQE